MIHSCMGCIPPERHPGCHATCEKYLAEKAAHDKRKAELDQKKNVDVALYLSRTERVGKALRKKRGYSKTRRHT